MERLAQNTEKSLEDVLKFDRSRLKSHLDKVVCVAVEETLNRLLNEEAEQVCGAGRYERTSSRLDTRSGHYERNLDTKSGRVKLKVPRLRNLPLESQIIERYRRRESSVEEALMEMYLAGVSVRRVEDITEALWGTRVSSSTVSDLNKKVYRIIEKWRCRPITGEHPYVYLDGICLKRCWGGEVRNLSVLVAISVNREGFREILGVCEGAREDLSGWLNFLRHLKSRGLKGVKLIVSDKCLGLIEAAAETFSDAHWQRCMVHWFRNVFNAVPRHKVKLVAAMLKAIHAQEDRKAADKKGKDVVDKLRSMKLKKAAELVSESLSESLTYMKFPASHWERIRTNNPLERIMKEIRRRTRVVGSFPDGESAVMLTAGRLRHIAGTRWGNRRYLDMSELYEIPDLAIAGNDA